MISFSLELKCIARMTNTSSNLFQTTIFEINFLISIILGIAFCPRTKTILVIERERENIQLDFIKTNTFAQTSFSSSFTINFFNAIHRF